MPLSLTERDVIWIRILTVLIALEIPVKRSLALVQMPGEGH